ncbi:MAG: MinD/ParA family protein [bacterium]|nr:MinD/ParA family protein [bacterium]
MKAETTNKPILVPVAGGKGGVGKSMITANLAIALAGMGYRTVAIDMDLGGSNLHSFLGIPNKYRGIGDFVKAKGSQLEDFQLDTAIENLSFIPGDGVSPFMANIHHYQKTRLLSQMKRIPADFILVDLGAGTSFNTLDFFAISQYGLLIAAPEFLSVVSTLGFLKNYLFRVIEGKLKKRNQAYSLLEEIYRRPMGEEQVTVASICEEMTAVDPEAVKIIGAVCSSIRPRVIFNRGKDPGELSITRQLEHGLGRVLSLEGDYPGFVFADGCVDEALQARVPLLTAFPDSLAAMEIVRIARRLIKFNKEPISNSAQLLLDSTRWFYEKHNESEPENGLIV